MDKTCKRPESVLVVIYTDQGEVLMLNRVRPKGFWQSVTGSLEWGETPRQAAERELYEETGLRHHGKLQDTRHTERFTILPAWRGRFAPSAHYNREHLFYFRLPSRRLIRLNPHEHGEMRWLPAAQAARKATSWTNRNAILRLLNPA
ncbi:dihydroneopterin triphosphate diphosphatase [Sedimenticola selenatireducens]|uniref:dihydroneopterin triphosphate diphosphatase n=1 Tax=Sedimenticola selenatireducens TaxID=191960 RepID=UPI0004B6CDDB|nr:dihydroneopterin triphosphate diphosphatase [Sedimenticola selenatireducens]